MRKGAWAGMSPAGRVTPLSLAECGQASGPLSGRIAHNILSLQGIRVQRLNEPYHLAAQAALSIMGRDPMDWREEYKRRLASGDEAMKLVKAGDLVMIPIAGPRVLPGALFRHCTENGVAIDLRVAAPLTDPGWFRAGHEETFRVEFELFIGDFARPTMDEGQATYLPNLFSLNFKDIDEKRPESRPVEVFLVSVTSP